MGQRTLLPDGAEVVLDQLQVQGRDRILMVLRPAREGSCCPACQRRSERIHSWYRRRLRDLPWEGIPVRIELRVRRLFCDSEGCARRIFSEQLAKTAPRYARRTSRLSLALEQIRLALGGSAGSRLAEQLGILASDSTLLRQLRRRIAGEPASPRVLGIDAWAWRKGHRYGTILCDLERGKVIDLLADRSAESTERWLREHPGTAIISRDRAGLYARAAAQAAPGAVQVADRWHLLHNMTEALMEALTPHHRLLNEVAQAVEMTPAQATERTAPIELVSRARQRQQQNRQRRLARYEMVMEKVGQGLAQREIARVRFEPENRSALGRSRGFPGTQAWPSIFVRRSPPGVSGTALATGLPQRRAAMARIANSRLRGPAPYASRLAPKAIRAQNRASETESAPAPPASHVSAQGRLAGAEATRTGTALPG